MSFYCKRQPIAIAIAFSLSLSLRLSFARHCQQSYHSPPLPSSLSLSIIISSSWHHAQQTKSLEFRLRTTANDLWSPQFLDQKFKLLSRSLSKCLLMYMWDYSLHTHIVIKDQKTIYPWLTRNSLEYWFKKSNNNNNGRQNPYLPLVLNINLLPFGGVKHGFSGFRPLMF